MLWMSALIKKGWDGDWYVRGFDDNGQVYGTKKDKEGKTMTTPIAQFMVKHPDKDDLIIISKVQLIENKKIINKGFWVETDEEGNFFKGSAVSVVLNKLGCETLADTYGKEIDTIEESEESPYLCIKAY